MEGGVHQLHDIHQGLARAHRDKKLCSMIMAILLFLQLFDYDGNLNSFLCLNNCSTFLSIVLKIFCYCNIS